MPIKITPCTKPFQGYHECCLSHRASVEGELCRKMHASGQAKRIHVQHWVVRVQQLLCHRVEAWNVLAGSRWVLWALLLRVHRWELSSEGCRVRTWSCGVGGVLVVNHFRLGIVLLFCIHELKLGPEGSTKRNMKKGAGQLAELFNVILEWRRVIGSTWATHHSSPTASLALHWDAICSSWARKAVRGALLQSVGTLLLNLGLVLLLNLRAWWCHNTLLRKPRRSRVWRRMVRRRCQS